MEAAVEPLKARRIYLLLRERIGSGALAVGEKLPGELSLAAEFGVSRMTLRRAMDRLVQENLIERRVGVGAFVHDRAQPHRLRADLSDVIAYLQEMGRQTTVRLLSFAYVVPPEPVAAALNLKPGARTQRSERVRCMEDGAEFSHLTTYVPEHIGMTFTAEELMTTPMLSLLERSGAPADRATQTMTATLAGPDVAQALGAEIGSPLLSLTRVVYDPNGQAVELLQALYRPDRFSLQMELLRTGRVGARRWQPMASSVRGDATTPSETRSKKQS